MAKRKDASFVGTMALLAAFVCLTLMAGLAAAAVSDLNVKDTEVGAIYIGNATKEQAYQGLLNAEKAIEEMKSYNLSTLLVSDLLLDAKRHFIGDNLTLFRDEVTSETDISKIAYLESLILIFEATPSQEVQDRDIFEVVRITNIISLRKKEALSLIDEIALVEDEEIGYRNDGIDTTEAKRLLDKAKESFAGERYEEARDYLKQSGTLLDNARQEATRVSKIMWLSKNFFQRYWVEILIALAIIAVVGPPVVLKLRKVILKKQINALKAELSAIAELIKRSQEDYIKNKTISKKTYEVRLERYNSRTAEIKSLLPVLESNLAGKKIKKTKERKGIIEVK